MPLSGLHRILRLHTYVLVYVSLAQAFRRTENRIGLSQLCGKLLKSLGLSRRILGLRLKAISLGLDLRSLVYISGGSLQVSCLSHSC